MSEDQTMSAEEFQNQYFNEDGSEALAGELEYDLETGLVGEHDQFANLPAELEEAREQLVSIRDFIRFSVTQLRNYDVVVAQGTTDEFAEASAIVLHTLSLDWSANEQILDCRLTTSEKLSLIHI